MSIAVVYLARGKDGGLQALKEFVQTYQEYETGVEHVLYILVKGWENEAYKSVIPEHSKIIELPDDGFDWGAYFRACQYLEEDYVCFLNTHSRIQKDNWLALLHEHIQKPDIGLAGCTASYGTLSHDLSLIFPVASSIAKNRGYLKGTINVVKAIAGCALFYFYDRPFPAFPNPHIRSNAFIIAKSDFEDFVRVSPIPQTKREAFKLECGYAGLTRFIIKKGFKTCVVNNEGNVFFSDAYDQSGTFRVPESQKCLVSDNQTRYYEQSEHGIKQICEITAWGHVLTSDYDQKA